MRSSIVSRHSRPAASLCRVVSCRVGLAFGGRFACLLRGGRADHLGWLAGRSHRSAGPRLVSSRLLLCVKPSRLFVWIDHLVHSCFFLQHASAGFFPRVRACDSASCRAPHSQCNATHACARIRRDRGCATLATTSSFLRRASRSTAPSPGTLVRLFVRTRCVRRVCVSQDGGLCHLSI